MKKRNLIAFIGVVAMLFSITLTPMAMADSTSAPFINTKITSGSSSVPVGTIIAWPVSSNPEDMENWLECNGQNVSQSAYPELYAVIGLKTPDLRDRVTWGAGKFSPGAELEAGLPNITGKLFLQTQTSTEGAFSRIGDGPGDGNGDDGWTDDPIISFDASHSNPIYGRNDTVQPPAVAVRFLIRAVS